jgi:eukaryotic-like serine/threonine-protein kinase
MGILRVLGDSGITGVGMGDQRNFAVLGPLPSAVETQAFLGCEVWGHATRPDRPVVVIWLPNEVTDDPSQLEHVQRETAFVTSLEHPNLIRVHGVECFDEGWARIVSYVDGEPLRGVLEAAVAQGIVIEAPVVARMVLDLCEGIEYAHNGGAGHHPGRPVVHGGIRPETLLVGFDGRTVATGYGAAFLGSVKEAGTPYDRLAYLAPEQLIGGASIGNVASDVYGIGTVLYELLTLDRPFAGTGDIEKSILTEDIALPASNEPLSELLGQVARKALSKRGASRYASVAHLKEAILAAHAEAGVLVADNAVVAEFLDWLIPENSPERKKRATLLASAADPEAVTILSRRESAPPGVDPNLFEASRPFKTESGDGEIFRDNILPSDPPDAAHAVTPLPDVHAVETIPPPPRKPSAAPNAMASALVQGAGVVKGPLPKEISVITQFNRKAGDASRAILATVLLLGAGLLVWILAFPKEPPPGLADPIVDSEIPREVLQEIFREDAPPVAAPSEPVPAAGDQPGPTVDPKAEAASKAAEPSEANEVGGRGMLELTTDPVTRVYDDKAFIGRTPFTAKLSAGVHQLHFRDSKLGIDYQRTYRIKPDGRHRDNLTFGKSKLQLVAPEGARVSLSGRDLGTAPFAPVEIYEGRYLLKVSLGGSTWSEWVDAPPGKTIDYKVNLDAVR